MKKYLDFKVTTWKRIHFKNDQDLNETINDSLPESLSVNETIIEDLDIELFFKEDDNLSIISDYCIDNLFTIKPLHNEFINNYNLF